MKANLEEPVNIGERSFSHAGPSAWNALPSYIRAVGDMKAFGKAVKTHYFSVAF